MTYRATRGRILPKISTMPRQKNEAAAYLELYKLEVEKKRLQQELQKMEVRRQQIHQRLAELDTQIVSLEQSVPQLRENSASGVVETVTKPVSKSENLDSFLLEY